MGTKQRYEKGQELVDDLVCAHGSWASVMKSPKYRKMAQENIGFLREHFDFFSREAVSDVFSEEAIADVSKGEKDKKENLRGFICRYCHAIN
jgi:hypothetical protein